jgi:mono/diheme cytochrome c family protein/plastocyanin
MSEERTGRELTPREEGEVTPLPGAESLGVERFSAGPRAHTVGLTEERGAQIVRQSGNARNVAFLAVLVLAIFIPVYWFYDIGIPALGVEGRMPTEKDVQFVTDVERGYALFLANCARCHGPEGKGGVGPPLNDQAKLYNAVQLNGQPGTGHLNPVYLDRVLEVGGRYVCGDPKSVMPAWKQPFGPLNYREVEELITFLTASNEVRFTYDPSAGHAAAAAAGPQATPYVVTGWRDPNYEPPPGEPTPPACWRNPSGQIGGGGGTSASAPPIASPGTAESPRVIRLKETATLQITDEAGTKVGSIAVKPGETVTFEVENTAGFPHNFYIGTDADLAANATADLEGIPDFDSGTQSFTWTAPESDGLRFGCTIPGHYQSMNGDIDIQE